MQNRYSVQGEAAVSPEEKALELGTGGCHAVVNRHSPLFDTCRGCRPWGLSIP